MKLISWNVNGLRAVMGKNFMEVFSGMDADFFCLQETKLQGGQIEMDLPGYHQYWNYAEKKGYSGTAIFTKHEPLAVSYGLGIEEHDHEGRVITLAYPDFYLITVYVPNAQDELKRLPYRISFEDDFRSYVKRLETEGLGGMKHFTEKAGTGKANPAEREATATGGEPAAYLASGVTRGDLGGKPVIYCGDLNVAHEEIDLKNPKTNRGNPGFSDEERGKMTEMLASGMIDTFRTLYPAEPTYSWWSYRFHAREKNVGWRIDYFLISEELRDKLVDAKIHTEIYGSDHCPVELDMAEMKVSG